jgi:hypothetical protein
MRRTTGLTLLVAAVATVATGVTAAAATTSPPEEARAALQARVVNALAKVDGSAASTPAAGRKTRELGQISLEQTNADVWSHGDFAYVGTWAIPCSGTGVKIVDVSDPSKPELVATAAGYPGTSAEDMEVLSVDTPAFTGDLLAVGIQQCSEEEGFGGLALWDVTDPTDPEELGVYENFGVHELSLTERPDGVFALLASPFSEPFTFFFAPETIGDFQLVDITDPANPSLTDDWGALKDAGFPAGAGFIPPPYDCSDPLCRGAFAAIFAHSTKPSGDGTTAYVAYWDLGAVVLDISDPTDVTFVGRTVYPLASDGDTHSAVPNGDDSLLATTDEDFSPVDLPTKVPGDTWGFARLWDISNPSSPVRLSDVTTPHSLTNKTDAFYSAHNPEFAGDKLYVSWYSDGLRIFDVSDPASPREIGFYRGQPNRGLLSPRPIPLDWGVHVEGGRIYLSDMSVGLYIIEEK